MSKRSSKAIDLLWMTASGFFELDIGSTISTFYTQSLPRMLFLFFLQMNIKKKIEEERFTEKADRVRARHAVYSVGVAARQSSHDWMIDTQPASGEYIFRETRVNVLSMVNTPAARFLFCSPGRSILKKRISPLIHLIIALEEPAIYANIWNSAGLGSCRRTGINYLDH